VEGKDKLKLLGSLFFIFPYFVYYYFNFTAYDHCKLEMEQTGVDLDCDDGDADWYEKEGYEHRTDTVSIITHLKKTGFGLMSSSSGGG
jgi:hypothetical protein